MCHKLHKAAIVHAAAILPNRSARRQPIQFSGPRALKKTFGFRMSLLSITMSAVWMGRYALK